MKKFAGICVRPRGHRSRRYFMLSGVVDIAEGLVKIISFGMLLPDWSLRFAMWSVGIDPAPTGRADE